MNKKHFLYKGVALILLVVAELEVIYEKIGIHDPNTKGFIKVSLVALAVLLAFGFDLSHRRRVTRNLLEVISDKLFRNKQDDGVYRVTCYKYANPLQCLLWYRIRNFAMVLIRNERNKKRQMDNWSKGYLVCYERYSWRRGTKRNYKSSISFLIDESNNAYKGFAGRIFASPHKREIAVNVGEDVNDIVNKLKKNETAVSAFENEKYRDASVVEGITKLRSSKENGSVALTDSELGILEKFMELTNTNLFQLMTIHNGVHATHFLGFKVYKSPGDYKEGRSAWGVITIDALDQRDFPECCLKVGAIAGMTPTNFVPWVDFVLENFTAIFPSMTGE